MTSRCLMFTRISFQASINVGAMYGDTYYKKLTKYICKWLLHTYSYGTYLREVVTCTAIYVRYIHVCNANDVNITSHPTYVLKMCYDVR